MYIESMNIHLMNPGIAATASGVLVLLFGKRWYWISAAIPLVVLGLAWTFFGT